MSIANEALIAFVLAVEQGSFSAAARVLGKRQSSISESIANLEIDLGVSLFDRRGRQPVLTDAGSRLLPLARQALAAQDTLQQQAQALASGVEARLTLVLSDTYHTGNFETALSAFEQQFPATALECLVGEQEDVLTLIQSGRAQLGILSGDSAVGGDLACVTLAQVATTSLYVAPTHVLAKQNPLSPQDLYTHRQLRLNTYRDVVPADNGGACWYAPSYLLLLEMTQFGRGWAELPDWLVARYASELVALPVQGWPRRQTMRAVWSRQKRLGPAAAWMLALFQQA